MLFSSWQFIFVFLPASVVGFLLLPAQTPWLRKSWLLLASLLFYAYWKAEYVPLLLASCGFNYGVAEMLARLDQGSSRRTLLTFGVALNLLLLGYFKYTNFAVGIFSQSLWHEPARFSIILPLAISFFTFTQIGYLVDVYRDRRLHYGFFDYALFVSFFPHLIAGPIVRHWEIIPQYARRELRPLASDFQTGLALFLLGLGKKVLLADPVAGYVADVYGGAPSAMAGLTWFDAWLGTLAFALQIYFDFSGYSDMAIGLARLFGIRFPINFRSPYQATSVAEFWKRWHITLTRFLREYVYFPLGGNRCGPVRHMLNLMATMLLSGLWHGAGWTFVIWGGLHGLYLVIAQQWRRLVERCGWQLEHRGYRLFCGGLTFGAVLFAWVFFKASSLAAALRILTVMLGRHGLTMSDEVTNPMRSTGRLLTHLGIQFTPKMFAADYSSLFLVIGVMLLGAVLLPNSQELLAAYDPALESVQRRAPLRLKLGLRTGAVLGGMLFLVLRTFYTGAPSPFLYFNF